MSKEIENILFDVYEKGVKQEDCDLTEVYEKLIKLLNQKKELYVLWWEINADSTELNQNEDERCRFNRIKPKRR